MSIAAEITKVKQPSLLPGGSHWLTAGGIAGMAQIPLKRGDIPLSAIDFHISSIVEELLQKPAISAAAHAVAARSGHSDPNDCLRRAMWLFRSSLSSKNELGADEKVRDDSERQALHALWQASHAAADAWSKDFIRRRFI